MAQIFQNPGSTFSFVPLDFFVAASSGFWYLTAHKASGGATVLQTPVGWQIGFFVDPREPKNTLAGAKLCVFNAINIVFMVAAKQLFAKARARRRAAFAKSCFAAAFSSGSFAIFWGAICFLGFVFFWHRVWKLLAPRH